jgi:hypothetical protein
VLRGKSIGVAAQFAFGFICRNMVRVDPLLDQSLQLLMAGVQIIGLDKIVNLVPLLILDRYRLPMAGIQVVALLLGDFGNRREKTRCRDSFR